MWSDQYTITFLLQHLLSPFISFEDRYNHAITCETANSSLRANNETKRSLIFSLIKRTTDYKRHIREYKLYESRWVEPRCWLKNSVRHTAQECKGRPSFIVACDQALRLTRANLRGPCACREGVHAIASVHNTRWRLLCSGALDSWIVLTPLLRSWHETEIIIFQTFCLKFSIQLAIGPRRKKSVKNYRGIRDKKYSASQ